MRMIYGIVNPYFLRKIEKKKKKKKKKIKKKKIKKKKIKNINK